MLKRGYHVIGLDDFTTGSQSNIDEFLTNKKFRFIQHDVREPFDIECDLILNFACPASPIHYQADPVKTIETNFIGMVNSLQNAKKYGARVLQASTSEVYGDPKISPQREDYWGNVNPIGIRSCYDEGKRAAETLCFDYRRQHGMDVRVIRIFNTYGPSMALNDGRVVSNFIVQALQDLPITIYGDGSQTRSFCHAEDLIRAIELVALNEESIDSPINIGNPDEFTMIELASIVLELTESRSKIEFRDLPSDDPLQRKPDISKMSKIFNWYPEVELRDGIKKSIPYFKECLGL
jgi:UDP-glucuronate decarboxylase